MKGFIKDEHLISESYELEDLLNFSGIQRSFAERLNKIEKSSTICLRGKFGSGKSTMLYQLSKAELDDAQWVNFDAWKYPDRANLWEGFVLDLIKNINPSEFDKTLAKIEGESFGVWKLLIQVIFQGINIVLPGAAIGGNLANLLKTSPIKRVFQLQDLLLKFIKNTNKNKIYIVIEDIDRSGDSGMYFLETLKYFLREARLDKKIICIVPVDTDNFNNAKQSFLKVFDYLYSFEVREIDFSKFIRRVFSESICEIDYRVDQLNFFLKHVLVAGDTRIRELKSFIRNANIRFAALAEADKEKIDPAIFLAMDIILQMGGKIKQEVNGIYRVSTGISWLNELLVMMGNNVSDMKGFKTDIPMEFVQDQGRDLRLPRFSEIDGRYFISDLYLNLLV